jgi:hypothetical protein
VAKEPKETFYKLFYMIRIMSRLNIMQDEKQHKQFIQKTFDTVAHDYGLGTCRFFRLSGEIMAELLDLSGDELVLDVASGIFPAESDSDQGL